jgi:diguanylate cyclase (GGDEF)-like protein
LSTSDRERQDSMVSDGAAARAATLPRNDAPSAEDAAFRRRFRTVAIATSTTTVVGFGIGIGVLLFGSSVLGILLAGVCLLSTLNTVALVFTRRPGLHGQITTLVLFGLIVGSMMLVAGVNAYSLCFMILVPLWAGLLVHPKAGWIWTAISVVATVVLGTSFRDWQPPFSSDLRQTPTFEIINIVAALITSGLVTASFSRTQRQLECELRNKNEEVRAFAFYDRLTGLPNRQLFEDRARQAVALAKRAERHAALLYLDLDGFKDVNDSLGHQAGDAVLAEVARRIQRVVRESDTVARGAPAYEGAVSRVGGDEFTVLLSEVANPEGAEIVARRILDCFAEPVVVGANRVHIGASIGIALHPQDGADAASLVMSADSAMYESKRAGKGTLHFYDPSFAIAGRRRAAVESRLRAALERGEFELHYQPIWRLPKRSLAGAEALLRWTDPELGSVSPNEFIPVAEQTGLIVPLGKWVIEQACAQLAAWRKRLDSVPVVAVNISGVQLRHGSLVRILRDALDAYGIEPAMLELELTESAIMREDEVTGETLHSLHRMGLGLTLDDFGTGYSSLVHLKRLPVTCVKIDRAFVSGLPDSPDDRAITSAIVAMAHSLGVRTVGEGIETEAQLEFLEDLLCDAAQGFYLARPMPAARFEGLVRIEAMKRALAGIPAGSARPSSREAAPHPILPAAQGTPANGRSAPRVA